MRTLELPTWSLFHLCATAASCSSLACRAGEAEGETSDESTSRGDGDGDGGDGTLFVNPAGIHEPGDEDIVASPSAYCDDTSINFVYLRDPVFY